MATTPLLSATPGAPVTYNPSMAETFSWVPVEGAGRPLYAQASYLVGGGDISIEAASIQVGTDDVEALIEVNNTTTAQILTEAGNTNTLLTILTANTDSLEVNTDGVEALIVETNTKLDLLTAVDYATKANQDLTNTKLDLLTAVDYATKAKQDLTNTKLDALTANTDSIEAKQDTTNSLLSSQLGQSGFVFLTGGASPATGNFSTVQVVSACKIASINATNSNTNGLTQYELPVNFSFNGPITSISLTYGAAIVYKL